MAVCSLDFAFLSARFSLSDFPDFIDMDLRGDLSDIIGPSIGNLNGPDASTVRHIQLVPLAEGRWPWWPLISYFVLTETCFSILGVALLSADLPPRVGWMLIISVALLFVLTLIFRDMVPLVFYLVTMVTGVMLLS